MFDSFRSEPTINDNPESGLGLIEIVVSMFIIALLAMAFLPLLVRSFTTTTLNTTITTATQLLSSNMEQLRSNQTPTCATVTSYANATIAVVTDQRGVSLQAHRSVACPGTYPGVATFRAWVTEGAGTTATAEATTLVYVGSAS